MQMTSLSALALTCLLMFVGSVIAGLAPLLLVVSDSQLQTISAVGAGLLIGTALGVILPEGAEAFRTAQEESGQLDLRVLLWQAQQYQLHGASAVDTKLHFLSCRVWAIVRQLVWGSVGCWLCHHVVA